MRRSWFGSMILLLIAIALCIGSMPLHAASRPYPSRFPDGYTNQISPDGRLIASIDTFSIISTPGAHQFVATAIESGATQELGSLNFSIGSYGIPMQAHRSRVLDYLPHPDQIVRIATTGARRQEVLFQTPLSFNYPLIWSADGQSLLTWVRPADTPMVEISVVHYTDPPTATRIAQIENSPSQMFQSYNAALSPNGRFVAFNNDTSGDLRLAIIETTSVRIQTVGTTALPPQFNAAPPPVLFSPDQRWMLFFGICTSQASASLCRIDLMHPQLPAVSLAQPRQSTHVN